MSYLDTFTRAVADKHVNHSMLAKNNKFLALLLEAGPSNDT